MTYKAVKILLSYGQMLYCNSVQLHFLYSRMMTFHKLFRVIDTFNSTFHSFNWSKDPVHTLNHSGSCCIDTKYSNVLFKFNMLFKSKVWAHTCHTVPLITKKDCEQVPAYYEQPVLGLFHPPGLLAS